MNRHKTWEKPDKAELRQLNLAMLFKAVRLLLSSLAIFAYVQLEIWLSPGEFDITYTVIASLPIVIYYFVYRNAMVFGRHEVPDDYVQDNSLYIFLWEFANIILLIHLFFYFAEKIGIVGIVLAALMSVLTFWREWFMLILFVLRKYTVKDGEVCFHRKKFLINRSGHPGAHRAVWFSAIFVLDFEDACKREIPVMVDLFTYLRFKKNGDALLINYKYGESYLFEIVKTRKRAGDPVKQDEVIVWAFYLFENVKTRKRTGEPVPPDEMIEFKSEAQAEDFTGYRTETSDAVDPEFSDRAIVTDLARMRILKEDPDKVIDKAEWHYDTARQCYCEQTGKNPEELTEQDADIIWGYAGNHIAFFITWLLRHDRLGNIHYEDVIEAEDIEAVKKQEKTGMDIFSKYCYMSFADKDVSDLVMDFVKDYYDKQYLKDYGGYMRDKVLGTGFSWDDYLGFEPVIDRAFEKFH
jgi:hypothetical protein